MRGMLLKYVHTIKHLTLKQCFFLVYYRCVPPSASCSVLLERRPWRTAWSSRGAFPSPLSDAFAFSFQGKTGDVAQPLIWNDATYSKLWLYNLHYFDALNAADTEEQTTLLCRYVEAWIAHNPPFQGNGWEPYTLSLRMVNWVKWFSSITPNATWLSSLALQAACLSRRIEHHLQGNHLIANGKALVFVGVYFSGRRADKWLNQGLRILDRELKLQFLDDGGHAELSPMYHASLLADVCDVLSLAQHTHHPSLLQRQAFWRELVSKGLGWLSCMTHPDGDIAFFNDAALGIAPSLASLTTKAQQLGCRVPEPSSVFTLLSNTGYAVIQGSQGCKALLDVGNVGPAYQPGHAHADTLSFELSLYGQRVFVNSGTAEYGQGPGRQYQRGTLAHNTVCVMAENSSEVWGGFRVARRARVFDLVTQANHEHVHVACSHDGYRRLPGRIVHRRAWTLSENTLTIDDILSTAAKAEARFYVHPGITLSQYGSRVLMQVADHTVTLDVEGGEVAIMSAYWYPAFGVARANQCVRVTFGGSALRTVVTWSY